MEFPFYWSVKSIYYIQVLYQMKLKHLNCQC